MSPAQTTIGLTFAAYLALMLFLGWRGYRSTRDLSDFILGGRRLGSWVAALSAGASDMSGWLLLGLPGYAYLAGLESLWLSVGLLTGTWLNWRLQAPRLRVYSEMAGNALTLPEFLANRFHDHSGLLRIVPALFILLFFLFYTSSGLVAGGKLFEEVFDVPYPLAVTTGTLAILLYTSFGGFLAVSWTDLVQALLMAAALLVVPLLALSDSDTGLGQLDPALLDAFSDSDGNALGAVAILSLLAWGLGYFGQPHILARFQAIRSSAYIPKARRIAVTWAGLGLAGATLVGMAGVSYVDAPLADPEKIFIVLVNLLFHPLIAGILLAAILAAIMSTADSQLLVSSSTLTEDFYRTLLRPNAGSRELVLVGRGAVLLIALAAYGLALDPDSSVLNLVSYAWAGFGAAFGPTLLGALFWPRMTRNGALAGILSGGLTVVIWKQLEGGLYDLYEILPGFLISLLAIVIVSLLGRAPSAEIEAEFSAVERRLG